MQATLTRREALLVGAGALLVVGRAPEFALAAPSACYGWPADAGDPPVLPYASIYQETQCWWMQGQTGLTAPAADFAFTSAHVHAGISYPTGETIVKINGAWQFDFVVRLHNFQGGHGKNVRGGGFLLGGMAQVPVPASLQNPASADVMWRSVLRPTPSVPNGKHENRFTFDTTSPNGKRMYQSGAWWTFVGQSGAPVPATARGWYASTDYTNITVKTPFRASAPLRAGQTVSYALAQGAKWAFAYADPDIHHGSKGTVIFENRTGETGSFVIPADAKVLLLGGWEKASDGWNAGVLRLPLA
jgi:hypothetical protein